MSDPKDALYFSHNCNSRNDEDVVKLRYKLGWEGYGIYWAIYESLSEARGYKLNTDYEVIAFNLRAKPELVKSIVEDFNLFKVVDGVFWSDELVQNMEIKRLKSEKAKKAALKRWGEGKKNDYEVVDAENIETETESENTKTVTTSKSKVECECNADAMQTQCKRNADALHSAMQHQTCSNALKERKERKEKQEKEKIGAVFRKIEFYRKSLVGYKHQQWREAIYISHKLQDGALAKIADIFNLHLKTLSLDKLQYQKGLQDYKTHFVNWLRVQDQQEKLTQFKIFKPKRSGAL